jgi:ABC-type dipeptide/oligopeptide/nickel transport system permease component
VTFSIIQLPPGDFIETRITELRATGDEAAVEEVKRLSEAFHLDDPIVKQYLRWMGFTYFTTFQEGDKGLLQGQMGRSMETQKSVNDIVGDWILLTVLVSLWTILFTWAVAMPIGIYSAVRQYSWGDYVLTFVGFIGMCVPNFLLAILLMYWSGKYLGVNVTGLFSPEFAAAPEWTVAKIVDLLKHIWVPVIVIATAGTAGMIRVMRGNLLDELRKPYVTTAMAKGVRPFRLLMKYPVRLALNPFISGIGGIFPQLISGGAIVAIVLSLPMVGPLMLQGLMTQDIYLAGSMLMVLSLLGIFGTLVSDLLLLWLDPRIRMEGGSK